ncbi:MAG: pyruvate formate-lyase-activating protein, partial [Clostridiaceae bacterium]
MIKGRIHSVESMGLVDGPGIRTVVFMQGCNLRCKYCHNPDTWAHTGGQTITPKTLVEKLIRYKTYYSSSGGGVTFSGGEPLLQPRFLLETLCLCKEAGIHTCLDTSGVGIGLYDEILSYTDLVIYDVKHFKPESYLEVTGKPMDETLKFFDTVQRYRIPLWVRHVVVPGMTDGDEHIEELAKYLKGISNLKKIELLCYNNLGVRKYYEM